MRRTPQGDLTPYGPIFLSTVQWSVPLMAEVDDFQMARFICAHTIMLALEGTPAIYIHSLLGTENNREGMAFGRARTINRYHWEADDLYLR